MLNPFRTPTADRLARAELAQAERNLLQAHNAVEYATAMRMYHENQVNRLRRYIQQIEQAERAEPQPH